MSNIDSTPTGISGKISEENPHVLIVTINNPPSNAMSIEHYLELTRIFEGIKNRPEVRCAILTGAGSKCFSAGGDYKILLLRTPAVQLTYGPPLRNAYASLRDCAVPVIAAVNGHAIGSGSLMASSCDIVVASEHAGFAISELDAGTFGGSCHFRQSMPDKIMRYMTLTGDRLDARRMQQYGFVQEVVAQADVMKAALAIAGKIARKSPYLMRAKKELMSVTANMNLAEGFYIEQTLTAAAIGHPDANEAALSRLEKREPRWADV